MDKREILKHSRYTIKCLMEEYGYTQEQAENIVIAWADRTKEENKEKTHILC